MTRLLRTLLLAAAALIALAAAPAAASAGAKQFSIFEDDAVLLGLTDKDPDKAMAEVKYLGADVVRAFVVWSRVSPQKKSRTVPGRLRPRRPQRRPATTGPSTTASWRCARKHGLKVMLTLSGEIPYWASREPDRCPHHIGGYDNLALSCMWKPDRNLFEQFVAGRGHPLQGPGRVLLAVERAEPRALPLSPVLALASAARWTWAASSCASCGRRATAG